MFAIDFFSGPAWLLNKFYEWTGSYALSLALIGVVVILVLTPLTLKSTKGMLEMQLVQPEMRRLQQEHKGDRQALNAEMMKLYQEHKINPLSSCLPLVAQMPVFIIMFRIIRGLTRLQDCSEVADQLKALGRAGCETLGGPTARVFNPDHLDSSTKLFQSLVGKTEMNSLGLELSKTPAQQFENGFGNGLIYLGLIVFLAFLYWLQQRLVANRAVSPTMSDKQQKLMQYLPVFFAIFQIFLPTGLVIYYIAQTVLRIVQQMYITQRFYRGDNSLGKKAADAGLAARDLAAAANGGEAPKGFRAMLKEAAGGPSTASTPTTARSTELRPDGRPKNPGAKGAQPRKPTGAQRPAGNRPAASHQKSGPTGPSRHPKPKK